MEWKAVFALCVFIALWGESYGNAADQIQRLTGSINLKNTLNFGDKCNYQSEQSRQKYIKDNLDLVKEVLAGLPGEDFHKTVQEAETTIVSTLDSLSKLHGNLCNISQNLACLPAGTCGCAENDMSTGYIVSFEREGNACVVKAGTNSVCIPKEITSKAMDSQRGPPPPMFRSPASMASAVTCPVSERCLMKDSEDECSEEKVQKKIAADLAEQLKSGKLNLGLLLEGLCVCAGTNLAASILVITVSTVVGVIRRFSNTKSFIISNLRKLLP